MKIRMRTTRPYVRGAAALAIAAAFAIAPHVRPAMAAMGDEPTQQQAAPKASAVSYKQAEKLVRAGKYKEGLAALKALNDKGNANAWNLMGYSSRKLGDLKNAERYYKTALKLNPKHRGALEYYGELMVEKGNAKGAMTHLASLKAVCGNCEEYKDLRATMQKAGIAVN